MNVIVKIANAGTTSMQGLDITIENHAGEIRHGKDWSQKMAHDYGYINDSIGADGDEMDVFVGPNKDADNLYIIEQQDEDGNFDEYKVMAGFSNMAEAKDAYHANYPKGWNGFKNMTELPAEKFWGWHDGMAGHQNEIVVTKAQKDLRKKLVRDEEGYAGRPDFSTKENTMLEETYRVGGHNRDELISRGQHTYGSKVDNSVCECPVCFGGKRLGMFACRNCKGTGVIHNKRMIKAKDLKTGMTVLVYDEPYKVTGVKYIKDEGVYSVSLDYGETADVDENDSVEIK